MAKASEPIFLRVRVEDARALRKAAKAHGMPLATFVRWAALRWTTIYGDTLPTEKEKANA